MAKTEEVLELSRIFRSNDQKLPNPRRTLSWPTLNHLAMLEWKTRGKERQISILFCFSGTVAKVQSFSYLRLQKVLLTYAKQLIESRVRYKEQPIMQE